MARRITLLTLLMTILLVGVSGAQTITLHNLSDQFSVLEQDGIPVGTSVERINITETGYQSTSELTLYTMALGEVSVFTMTSEVLFDHSGVITRAKRVMADSAVETQNELACTISYGELNTQLMINGELQDTSAVLQPNERLYTLESFLTKVSQTQGLNVGDIHQFKTLDNLDFTVQEAEVIIEEQGTYQYLDEDILVYQIHVTMGDEIMTGLIDENINTYYQTSLMSPGLVVKRVSADQLPVMNPMQMDRLIKPANVDIYHPHRSFHSMIRLYSKTSVDQLQLKDNRQFISEYNIGDGVEQVLLEINSDRTYYPGKYRLPIVAPNLSEFLGADSFVNPFAPEVQALATKILGNQRDAWLAVKSILNWITYNIEFIPSAIQFPVAQTLEIRAGSQNEFVNLFASLTRSVGIPTRFAVGYQYNNNGWIPYIWNEVWLGEWIAVDTGNNLATPGALLVKLADAPTLAKIHRRLTAIIDDVELEIVLVESRTRVAKNNVKLETGFKGQTYTNAPFGLQVSLPPQWQYLEQGINTAAFFGPEGYASVIVQSTDLPQVVTNETLMNKVITTLAQEFQDAEFYPPEQLVTTIIGGKEALTATVGVEPGGMLVYLQVWTIVDEDIAYLITYSVPVILYGYTQGEIEFILDNIQFHF